MFPFFQPSLFQVAFWACAACLLAANAQVTVPVVSRSTQYFAQTHSALTHPIAQYFAPSASVSQVTHYGQYLAAPYLLPAPLLATPAAPSPAPQQPPSNPDAEAVEVEAARLRTAPGQQAGKALPLMGQKQQVPQAAAQKQQQSAAPGLLSAQQFPQGPFLG